MGVCMTVFCVHLCPQHSSALGTVKIRLLRAVTAEHPDTALE